jgi:hypothetical protein
MVHLSQVTGVTGRVVIVCPGGVYPGGTSLACVPRKIVAWNCNAGFGRNLPALRALKPDIAVLSPGAPPRVEA